MLVYSITDDTSFAKLDAVHKEVTEKLAGRPVPFFLIGTKKDLSSDRAVSEKERTAKAAKWGCQSFEVSSKTDEGVSEVFERMAQAILAVSGDTSKGTGSGATSTMGAGKVAMATEKDVLPSKSFRKKACPLF